MTRLTRGWLEATGHCVCAPPPMGEKRHPHFLVCLPICPSVHPLMFVSALASVCLSCRLLACSFICGPFRLFLCVSVHLFVCLSIGLLVSLRTRLFIGLFVHPSVCHLCWTLGLVVCLSIHPFVCSFVRPSVFLSVCLSVRPSSFSANLHVSIHPSVRLWSVCLSMGPSIYRCVKFQLGEGSGQDLVYQGVFGTPCITFRTVPNEEELAPCFFALDFPLLRSGVGEASRGASQSRVRSY